MKGKQKMEWQPWSGTGMEVRRSWVGMSDTQKRNVVAWSQWLRFIYIAYIVESNVLHGHLIALGRSSMKDGRWDERFWIFLWTFSPMSTGEEGEKPTSCSLTMPAWETPLWGTVFQEGVFWIVLTVLKSCWVHCSKVKKIFPRNTGWQSPPSTSTDPATCCKAWSEVSNLFCPSCSDKAVDLPCWPRWSGDLPGSHTKQQHIQPSMGISTIHQPGMLTALDLSC